nr:hypothetical protein [Tanacetum cinerariifolium]
MQEKLKLSKSQGASTPAELKCMQNVLYALAVGFIMYVVRCTHPDVAFAQNVTSQFQQNLELRVSCFTDAGYLTDADDLKSQTGYVFVLNGGAVDWKSAKQSIFTTSSVEAKYIATFDASKEAVWVRKFIFGLGVVPISMYCDNTRAITIANESGITKGARHFLSHPQNHNATEYHFGVLLHSPYAQVTENDLKRDVLQNVTFDILKSEFTKVPNSSAKTI